MKSCRIFENLYTIEGFKERAVMYRSPDNKVWTKQLKDTAFPMDQLIVGDTYAIAQVVFGYNHGAKASDWWYAVNLSRPQTSLIDLHINKKLLNGERDFHEGGQA